jgi:hypothetical protein
VGLRAPDSRKADAVNTTSPDVISTPHLPQAQIDQDTQSPVPVIFKWLRDKKLVKSILKVVVKDDQTFPCRDDEIEAALKGLDVRYLDWNKLDLCSETIHLAAPAVKELWLYSSGNNSVLRGWAQADGLGKLTHVCSS